MLLAKILLISLIRRRDSVPAKQREYLNKVLAAEIPIEQKPTDSVSYLMRRYRQGRNTGASLSLKPTLTLWIKVKNKIGMNSGNVGYYFALNLKV